jgi:hypothetical protein
MKEQKMHLLKLQTSMPLETAALQIAEPTNPLPPNTTICSRWEIVQIAGENRLNQACTESNRISAAEIHAFSVFTSATTSIAVEE